MVLGAGKTLMFFGSLCVSGIAFAQADAGPAPASLASYRADFPSIQDLLQQGCLNRQVDMNRATFAYNAYEKASGLLKRLREDIQVDTLFLGNPTSLTQAELSANGQGLKAKAIEDLQTAQDQYEYDQRAYQLGSLDKSAVTRDRERIVEARARIATAEQGPAPEVVRRAVESRVAATKSSMQELEKASKSVTQVVSQAQECYSSATSSGVLANPAMDDKMVNPPVVETPAQPAPAPTSASSAGTPSPLSSSGGKSRR
jgi:hypothetical protein